MNILVCVKQVPDDFAKVHLGENGKPALEGIDKVVNAFDTYAVEMAVRLCENHGGRVVVATIGAEEEVRPSMVQMIAVGANQAYIYAPNTADADESATAAGLAELVKKTEETVGESFDLIMCGKESTDEISSQVGAMLAEKLNLPFVSSVIDVKPAKAGLCVKQETEEGSASYEVSCPAVVTVAKPEYDPRYPNLKSKMAARKAVIPYLTDALSPVQPAVRCMNYQELAKREAGVKIQEKNAVDAVARAIALMADDKVL